ncbi:MAG: type IV pilin N-terminal domain-containing protein [Thaumarchaeota archaeon]|nr:type IV pilin N-terminal domain-containing protein [Nitrososphaerota archaeon]
MGKSLEVIRSYRTRKRSALSPIIATVVLIAITLVAATAIGGFAFGVFSSTDNTAQVEVTQTSIPASVGIGVDIVYCSVSTGNSVGDGYIQLSNSGTASTTANSATFTYDGASTQVSLTGPCTVGPESTIYILILALPFQASSGLQYTGYVSTANGADVLFTGGFS